MILFGTFFRISSSEFWPITASKTWLTPNFFEHSLLQKPLLTSFLALFHLLPLSDVSHLILVKFVFSFFGVCGIWSLAVFYLSQLNVAEKAYSFYLSLTALAVAIASPTVLIHYFSVRSDQLAAMFFSFFILFCYQKKIRLSLLCLFLIPLAGIKELLFLPAGLLVFYLTFRERFGKKHLFFVVYGMLSILVWFAAYNVNAFYYLLETFKNSDLSILRISKEILFVEALALFLTTAAIIYIFIKSIKDLYAYAFVSIYFVLTILIIPQSFSFFISSLLPFIFIPTGLVIIRLQKKYAYTFLTLPVIFIYAFSVKNAYGNLNYISNIDQLAYIETTSKILKTHQLSYLDGSGILPRQQHYPCFASPDDLIANTSCMERIKNQTLDSIILTSRLLYLGNDVFNVLSANYTQIRPGFWVHNKKINVSILREQSLDDKQLPTLVLF